MSKGLVLITGINGFIAGRTAEYFLKAGFSVRGTARSKTSTKAVVEALSKFGHVEIAEIKDITAPGAFEGAVKGITHIAHLASPVAFNFEDPAPIINAAVSGTTEILDSAIKEPGIQAVVLMSSVVAIRGDKDVPYVFTEADWNQQSLDEVAKHGKSTPGRFIYAASKTAAEKAFWKFRDDHKPSFAMTAINPSYVAGASLISPTKPEDVGLTQSSIYKALTGGPIATSGLSPDFQAFVDVRDVARLVVFGAEHPEVADGQRYLCSAGLVPQQAFNDVLRKAYPNRRDIIEEGKPGEGYEPGYKFFGPKIFDSSKAVRESGQDFLPMEDTILTTAKSFEVLL